VPGLYRYRSWLPVRRSLDDDGGTITYRSDQLCKLIGLKNLWIAFNGCWPEKDARLLSGTFKELKAHCVLGRIPAANQKVMVVASAGNTAAAFARICSLSARGARPQSKGFSAKRFADRSYGLNKKQDAG
jgi:cysteate synthase